MFIQQTCPDGAAWLTTMSRHSLSLRANHSHGFSKISQDIFVVGGVNSVRKGLLLTTCKNVSYYLPVCKAFIFIIFVTFFNSDLVWCKSDYIILNLLNKTQSIVKYVSPIKWHHTHNWYLWSLHSLCPVSCYFLERKTDIALEYLYFKKASLSLHTCAIHKYFS